MPGACSSSGASKSLATWSPKAESARHQGRGLTRWPHLGPRKWPTPQPTRSCHVVGSRSVCAKPSSTFWLTGAAHGDPIAMADRTMGVKAGGTVSATFDYIERQLGVADVLVNNAAGNFLHRPSRCLPTRGEASSCSTEHSYAAWTSPVARSRHLQPGRSSTSAPLTSGRAARHRTFTCCKSWSNQLDPVSGCRVGAQGHSRQLPCLLGGSRTRICCAAVATTSSDRWKAHSRRTRRTTARARLGGNVLCSQYAACRTGHTVALDGGNWLAAVSPCPSSSLLMSNSRNDGRHRSLRRLQRHQLISDAKSIAQQTIQRPPAS